MMYAGKTASLPDQTANPPIANSRKSMYFASSSETRPPYFLKNRGVRKGRIAKTTTLTPTKISVLIVNGEKIIPRAITVPRSLMKQAASTALPKIGNVETQFQHHRIYDRHRGRRKGNTREPTGTAIPMQDVAGHCRTPKKRSEETHESHHCGFFPFPAEDLRIEFGRRRER